ncbi:hypothetical protein BDY21DRAFT_359711 [Lineolata rhizophorae]|uniref:Uncharacterized protein n=1 Tax=Lineolata rhizophorae TaxID=578093 RepID=A0A6A6NKN2_9PEZI|nr:hypothetical protein BDY21DRAFT_359711 [Lineolata rhizophorae]
MGFPGSRKLLMRRKSCVERRALVVVDTFCYTCHDTGYRRDAAAGFRQTARDPSLFFLLPPPSLNAFNSLLGSLALHTHTHLHNSINILLPFIQSSCLASNTWNTFTFTPSQKVQLRPNKRTRNQPPVMNREPTL